MQVEVFKSAFLSSVKAEAWEQDLGTLSSCKLIHFILRVTAKHTKLREVAEEAGGGKQTLQVWGSLQDLSADPGLPHAHGVDASTADARPFGFKGVFFVFRF